MAKDKIYVIPVAGLAVVKPGNRALADRMIRPEGEYVPAVSYYLRAVRAGALKIGEPPKPKPKAKPASKPKAEQPKAEKTPASKTAKSKAKSSSKKSESKTTSPKD
jgi:hypothetical protein